MFRNSSHKLFIIFILIFSFIIGINPVNSEEKDDKKYKEARELFFKLDEDGIEESIKIYNEILKKDPNAARALAGLAEAYSFKGFFNKASKNEYENDFILSYQHMQKALKLEPKNNHVKRALAYVYLNLNRSKEALNIANKLVESEEDNYENIYLAWSADGKRPEDVRITKVLESNSNFILAHYDLAKSYYIRRRNPSKAIIHLEKVVEISDSPYFRTYLGKVLRSRRSITRSIQEFDKALKIDPNNSFAKVNKGISLHYKAKYKESSVLILDALKSNPNFPEAYFFLGSNYYIAGDKNNSLVNYNKFLSKVAGQSKYSNYIKKARNDISKIN